MLLYLLRHADADTAAESDDARCLSEKGLAQAKKVARFCEAHVLQMSLVLSSPVRRAHETALIVSAHLRSELLVAPWLSCGLQPEHALKELRAFHARDSLMIVGHEPDFSRLAAHLLGLPGERGIMVRKASLTLLELDTLRPSGATLQFSLPCRLM
ncbi:MAG: phosphohistidine phosphatase [Chthoniobacter sp.]|jgi:phosphohistidine phosphatase|nr:phosphohistidine phosphatase [Chthoniobacter sp.]